MLVTMLLVAVFTMTLPGFASVGNMQALLRTASLLGVYALGQAIVMIVRGVDLSLIAVALVSTGAAVALMKAGAGLPTALAGGFAVALALGLFNGTVVTVLGLPPLLATLASALLFVGLARVALPSTLAHLPPENEGLLALAGDWQGWPLPLALFAICAIGLHLFLIRTIPGRFLYACGDSPAAARLTGIPVAATLLLGYTLCAVFAYVGGLLSLASTGMVDLRTAQSTRIFDVLVVAIVGGVGLAGARGGASSVVAGALLIAVAQNGMALADLQQQVQNALMGLVLLIAIVVDQRLPRRDDDRGADTD